MQNTHIATTIKQLCKKNNISITTLLNECNLTKSFIYDLEKRLTSPSCEKIAKIADYLNCSVDYLLGRTNDPKSMSNISSPVYIIGKNGEKEVRQPPSSKDRDTLLDDLGIHKTGYLMSKDNIKTELTDSEYNFLMNSLELFRQK